MNCIIIIILCILQPGIMYRQLLRNQTKQLSHNVEINNKGIAQAAFGSLSHLWTDHRLSLETKLHLYRLSVCSSLTHCCTPWALTRTVRRKINGFNSRCLHVITGGTTATRPPRLCTTWCRLCGSDECATSATCCACHRTG